MNGAVIRYRALAYIVGVGLLVLVCVGVPLEYAADQNAVVAIVGPIHGFVYIVYLLVAFDLARRCGWTLRQTLAVLLAGTIPFLTFVVERWVTNRLLPHTTDPEPVETPA